MNKERKLHGNKETVVKVCNWLSLPLQALGCCILYLVIEAFSRHSLAAAWSYMVESPVSYTHLDVYKRQMVHRFCVGKAKKKGQEQWQKKWKL